MWKLLLSAGTATLGMMFGNMTAHAKGLQIDPPKCTKNYGTAFMVKAPSAVWIKAKGAHPESFISAMTDVSNCFTMTKDKSAAQYLLTAGTLSRAQFEKGSSHYSNADKIDSPRTSPNGKMRYGYLEIRHVGTNQLAGRGFGRNNTGGLDFSNWNMQGSMGMSLVSDDARLLTGSIVNAFFDFSNNPETFDMEERSVSYDTATVSPSSITQPKPYTAPIAKPPAIMTSPAPIKKGRSNLNLKAIEFADGVGVYEVSRIMGGPKLHISNDCHRIWDDKSPLGNFIADDGQGRVAIKLTRDICDDWANDLVEHFKSYGYRASSDVFKAPKFTDYVTNSPKYRSLSKQAREFLYKNTKHTSSSTFGYADSKVPKAEPSGTAKTRYCINMPIAPQIYNPDFDVLTSLRKVRNWKSEIEEQKRMRSRSTTTSNGRVVRNTSSVCKPIPVR